MVPAILIYLLKANIALTLFYLAYRFGLRRLTFYTLNRLFLLCGIAFSAIYPFISIDDFINRHETLSGAVVTYVPDFSQWQVAEPSFSGWALIVYIFWVGVGVMAVRLAGQLWSLFVLHRKSHTRKVNETTVQVLKEPVNPFSFFNHIYINPSLHQPDEIDAIIHHETVHVKQWHTMDVLVGEINNIFYWFNPGAWLMKSAIRENLEFITDRYLLRQGVDKVAYQYSLIKVSGIPTATAIANNFNFSHLKNRIFMMNSKRSSRYQLLRYLVLGSLAGGMVLLLNYSKASSLIPASILPASGHAVEETVPVPPAAVDTSTPKKAPVVKKVTKDDGVSLRGVKPGKEPIYIINGKKATREELDALQKSDKIKSISVFKGDNEGAKKYIDKYGEQAKNGVIVIELKDGSTTSTNDRLEPVVVEGHAKGVAAVKQDTPSVRVVLRDKENQDKFQALAAEALVIVDGVPVDPEKDKWSQINPDKISSINVLKDESAIAIYGERAKKGVILITTTNSKNSEKVVEGRPAQKVKMSADTIKVKY
ncbi:TonB-dependent SusC/RagA subfamily outer membrane receptor [Chitinophaga terrae (ex Kim and Jung 2007)]|uniref:M56 family metallopeptidase n=1 Tax=Chitinophaga terrae (ex Kim and Jung 2007) TaxID=408074 RepID=UPI002788A5ED|nr:M56 family metallopeptidase [Chitinophaga terrae (ex Kim and Jung 2007)]MDQ0106119.1 TonB-dependent SusC/RagA subfamily outer membrane receptor [Chitinophaga terrae (ex Kim and Jung 2007)]